MNRDIVFKTNISRESVIIVFDTKDGIMNMSIWLSVLESV